VIGRWFVIRAAALGVALVLVVPMVASALDAAPVYVPIPQLVALPPSEDGKLVRITGEAIGEALRADRDHHWVNVLEGGTAVGVVVSGIQAGKVDGFGVYGTRGSIVEVVGTFNIACEEHEGDLDVHARTLRVLNSSEPIANPVKPWKPLVAAGTVASGLAALAAVRAVRRRRALL
jgi:hypothetical protein